MTDRRRIRERAERVPASYRARLIRRLERFAANAQSLAVALKTLEKRAAKGDRYQSPTRRKTNGNTP